MPAAAHVEKDGSFTNTQRLLQWHHKAVEPPGRQPLRAVVHLPPRPPGAREAGRVGRSEGPADPRPDLGLPDRRAPTTSPTPEAVLRGDQRPRRRRLAVSGFTDLEADGSTACGCWIYSGCYADGVNQTARRKPGSEQSWVAPEWGWAWPAEPAHPLQPRLRRPRGQALVGAQALRLVGRRGRANGPARTCPTSPPTRRPTTCRRRARRPRTRCAATSPSSCRPTGVAGCYVPDGLVDGPLPDPLRAARVARSRTPSTGSRRTRPARRFERPENPYNPTAGEPGADVFPFVMTTYRLTEHHTAGGMSRTVPYLAELQPEMFCEVEPGAGRRARPRARRLGDDRQRPHGDRGAGAGHRRGSSRCEVDGPQPSTRSACPTTGAAAGSSPATRPTTCSRSPSTPTCTSRRSRRRPATSSPAAGRAGPALPAFVASYRKRAAGEGRLMAGHAIELEAGAGLRRPSGEPRRVGFFTDTSVCIGCKACEVACKEWNQVPADPQGFTGELLRQQRRAGRRTAGATSPSSSRSCGRRRGGGAGLLGAGGRDAEPGRAGLRDARRRRLPLADELRRLQALHRGRLPRRLPDRLASSAPSSTPSSSRRTSATAAATASSPARSGCSTSARTTGGSGSARSATTACRTTWSRPARRPARPTRSSSAPLDELRERAGERGRGAARGAATRRRSLYGDPRTTASGGARRLLPAARRARGLRAAARPGRADPRDLRSIWGAGRRGRGRRSAPGSRPACRGAAMKERRWCHASGAPPTTTGRWSSRRSGSREIPVYFFTGGLAGASAVLACRRPTCAGADGARPARLGRSPSPAVRSRPLLLISDLGRPARFLNMLRVFKVTSPMSVGDLAAGGQRRRPPSLPACAQRAHRPAAASGRAHPRRSPRLLGPPLATYTAVLIANSAMPAWSEARRELPFVFAASAAASAAGAATSWCRPVPGAAPARAPRRAAALAEEGATAAVMQRRLGRRTARRTATARPAASAGWPGA